jgi:hypothetical protein
LSKLFCPQAYSRLWVTRPHTFEPWHASAGRAHESRPLKIITCGPDLVRRPNAFPSCIFFVKKEGLDSGMSSFSNRAIFRGVRYGC